MLSELSTDFGLFYTIIKMKYDDLENIKTDCVFIFLRFFGTPGIK